MKKVFLVLVKACRNQNIIEANGEVFPCDFYVIDSYSLGNIMNKPIKSYMKMKP